MMGYAPDPEGMMRRMGYDHKDNWGEFKSILPTTGEIVTFGIGLGMMNKALDSVLPSSRSSIFDDNEEDW